MVLSRFISCFVCALFIGCSASAPVPSGLTFSPLTELRRFNYSHLYFYLNDEDFNRFQEIKVIQVESVRIVLEGDLNNQYSLMRQQRDFLEERLYYNLVRTLSPRVIICRAQASVADYQQLNYPMARLKVSVVRFEPGSGWLRYLMGFFINPGIGGVLVEIEGSLYGYTSNEKYADFLVKIRYYGNQFFGPNPRVIAAKHCLREALDLAAEEIAEFCKFIIVSERRLTPQRTTNVHR